MTFFTAVFVVAILAVAPGVFAQTSVQTKDVLLGNQLLGTPAKPGALDVLTKPTDTYSPADTVGKVLNLIFGFIGLLAVSFIMYGGFLWVTSGGETDKAKKAQSLLADAAIGMVVLAAVWSLSWLILKTLAERIIAK